MNTDPIEILSAFIDGEEIPPRELAEALAAPGAHDALRDFALLRAAVREDESRPGPHFYAETERSVRHAAGPRWWTRKVRVPVLALAASILLIVALALWAGLAGQLASPAIDAPPEPDRIIHFRPGVDWNVSHEPKESNET